jgi:hypothetical protein
VKLRSPFLLVSVSALTLPSPALAQGSGATAGAPPADAPTDAPTSLPAAIATPSAAGPSGAPSVGVSADVNTTGPVKDEAAAAPAEEKKESTLPFRGSTLTFDQSMTTQTAHVETSPQLSYVPLYEWWISFRPRWYLSEHWVLSSRMDYYKELTNSDNGRTNYREDIFGDIWLNAAYTSAIPATSKNTRGSVGVRTLFPTSKESQANGYYVQAGLTASGEQKVPLKGGSASFLNSAKFGVGAWYNHPFSRATTPVSDSFSYTRQDTEGRSFVSDQVRGSTLVNHSLMTNAGATLQITPKLDFRFDAILINQWHYAPKSDTSVPIAGGTASVPRSADDQQHTVNTWMIFNFDYSVVDEVTLSLGYYNLANELAPNGQRRGLVGGDNIWWSPDARFFFDVTLNLDYVYEWARGSKADAKAAAAEQRVLQHLRQSM